MRHGQLWCVCARCYPTHYTPAPLCVPRFRNITAFRPFPCGKNREPGLRRVRDSAQPPAAAAAAARWSLQSTFRTASRVGLANGRGRSVHPRYCRQVRVPLQPALAPAPIQRPAPPIVVMLSQVHRGVAVWRAAVRAQRSQRPGQPGRIRSPRGAACPCCRVRASLACARRLDQQHLLHHNRKTLLKPFALGTTSRCTRL
jgi:hypothetical protein